MLEGKAELVGKPDGARSARAMYAVDREHGGRTSAYFARAWRVLGACLARARRELGLTSGFARDGPTCKACCEGKDTTPNGVAGSPHTGKWRPKARAR